MDRIESHFSPEKRSRKPQSQSTKALIDRWIDIYTAHYAHPFDDAEIKAVHRALGHIHAADLEPAFLKAMQECTYFPRVSEILSRVVVDQARDAGGRERIGAYIRPREYGYCYALDPEGQRMLDSLTRQALTSPEWAKRNQLPTYCCGCRNCKPEYWCSYVDPKTHVICERMAEANSDVCWMHQPRPERPT